MERKYETVLILKPDLSEEEKEGIINKISQRIVTEGGEVLSSQLWLENREFAYFLKSKGAEKKKYTRGNYWLINFKLSPDKLLELKETLRLEEGILRSFIVRKSDGC